MLRTENIEYGNYYHIFNKGINGTNLFQSDKDYLHFLTLYKYYITEVADTYAYCLLKNHFHLLVKIKEKDKIKHIPDRTDKRYNPSRQFAHLFNAYAQTFNHQNKRTGTLFDRSFKRKHIDSKEYFVNLIVYIHNNPVHHGFIEEITNYKWSSYYAYVTDKQTNIKKEEVLNMLEDIDNFKYLHKIKQDYTLIEKYIIE